MLSKKNLFLNWLAISIFSKLCMFPIRIDAGSKKIELERRLWKLGLYLLNILVWICHFALLVYQMVVEGIINYTPSRYNHMPCPIVCGSMSVLILGVNYHTFRRWPDVYLRIFNDMLDYIPDVSTGTEFAGHSRQEWLSILIFPVYLGLPIHHAGLFFLDTSAFYFVYFSVSAYVEGYLIMGLSVLVDFYIVTLWTSTLLFVLIWLLVVLNVASERLRHTSWLLTARSSTGRQSLAQLRRAYQEIRQLQLVLGESNAAASWTIFAIEKFIFYGSVTIFYFGARIVVNVPDLGAVYIISVFWCVLSYSVLFEKAFELPLRMTAVKSQIRVGLLVSVSIPDVDRQTLKKCLDSIPSLGIQRGMFGVYQRTTTINFIGDLVVRTSDFLIMF